MKRFRLATMRIRTLKQMNKQLFKIAKKLVHLGQLYLGESAYSTFTLYFVSKEGVLVTLIYSPTWEKISLVTINKKGVHQQTKTVETHLKQVYKDIKILVRDYGKKRENVENTLRDYDKCLIKLTK